MRRETREIRVGTIGALAKNLVLLTDLDLDLALIIANWSCRGSVVNGVKFERASRAGIGRPRRSFISNRLFSCRFFSLRNEKLGRAAGRI